MIYRKERQTIRLLASLWEPVIIGSDSSTPRGPAINASIGTETTLRESFPECAIVLAAGENLVGLDDGVTGLKERRPARLQLHAVNDKLSD